MTNMLDSCHCGHIRRDSYQSNRTSTNRSMQNMQLYGVYAKINDFEKS